MNTRLLLLLTFILASFYACQDTVDQFEAIFGDFTVDAERKIVEFDGTITATNQEQLEGLLGFYATVEELKFENANGNFFPAIAFEMADSIYSRGLNTSINDSGEVSQLGTYFFLGGKERVREGNGKIGVSSWKTVDGIEASTLPDDDAAHEPFINFLKSKGFSEDDAKAFYFFSLNAASSSDTYYLSSDEIENFGLLN